MLAHSQQQQELENQRFTPVPNSQFLWDVAESADNTCKHSEFIIGKEQGLLGSFIWCNMQATCLIICFRERHFLYYKLDSKHACPLLHGKHYLYLSRQ